MITENYITLEMARRGVTPCIDVMQGDKYCRDLMIMPHWEGLQMFPDGNLTVLIMYSKPDGTGGTYDKLPDGQVAYVIDGNSIRVKLAPQVCTAPGLVKLSLALIDGETVVHTFVIHIKVHATPGINVKSEDYNNTDTSSGTGATPEQLAQIQKNAEGIERLTEDMEMLHQEVASWEAIKDGNTITVIFHMESGGLQTDVITLDDNGYPVSITTDGRVVTGVWEGFDE